MVDHTPAENFLRSFFRCLEQSSTAYAVMRNYESLPYSHGGSDLDILVSPSSKQAVLDAINSTLELNKSVLLGVTASPTLLKFNILCNAATRGCGWWGISIDVFLGLYYKGLPLLNDRISWPTVQYRSISVLPSSLAGVLGVLKEVLHNRMVSARYLHQARIAAEQDWEGIQDLLAPMGPDALASFRQLVLQAPGDPRHACAVISRSFHRYQFFESPITFLFGRFFSISSKLTRYAKPSGIVIAILGTDGAGKSTIINAIKPVLDQATNKATVLRHLRPNFLPLLRNLRAGRDAEIGPVTDPHGLLEAGIFGSLFRLIYATFNYVLGYWLDTRPRIAKQPAVVIFDRYAYDMALDQKRFRIRLPPVLVQACTRLAPKPDLIFCLYGSPQVLALRKQELPIEEVTRQVEALKAFAAQEPRAILINTEQAVEVCRERILQAIFNYCDNPSRK